MKENQNDHAFKVNEIEHKHTLVIKCARWNSAFILPKVLFVILELHQSNGLQGIIIGMKERPSGYLNGGIDLSSKITGWGQGQHEKHSKKIDVSELMLAFGYP